MAKRGPVAGLGGPNGPMKQGSIYQAGSGRRLARTFGQQGIFMAEQQRFDQDDPRGAKGGPPPGRMKMSRGVMSWVGFILIALMILMLINDGFKSPKALSIGEFWSEVDSGNVKRVVITDNALKGEFREKRTGGPVSGAVERIASSPTRCRSRSIVVWISRPPRRTVFTP